MNLGFLKQIHSITQHRIIFLVAQLINLAALNQKNRLHPLQMNLGLEAQILSITQPRIIFIAAQLINLAALN